MVLYNLSRQGHVARHTSRRENMKSSLSSWITARKIAEAGAHSLAKRKQQGVPAPPTRPREVNLAVAAKAAQQV